MILEEVVNERHPVHNLTVASLREAPPESSQAINVTSGSTTLWARGLSPFFLGPCSLYDGRTAKNVENAWQYSKVYAQFIGPDNEILPSYLEWAQKGWAKNYADRYPMGKGAIPEFVFWEGDRLGYIEARKRVYLPLYAQSVVKTDSFARLQEIVSKGEPVTLIDFDVHAAGTQNLYQALQNPHKKFGHGFVLYGLLTGEIDHTGEFVGKQHETGSPPAQKRRPGRLFENFSSREI